jgi:hypothetical protein
MSLRSALPLFVALAKGKLTFTSAQRKPATSASRLLHGSGIFLKRRVIEVSARPERLGRVPLLPAIRKNREGEAVPVVIDGIEAGKIPVSDILPPA